jgi:hypothetical protein
MEVENSNFRQSDQKCAISIREEMEERTVLRDTHEGFIGEVAIFLM